MAHPDLVSQALAAGAAEVHFIGCPPEDCANREGNLIMQQRLERKRQPRASHDLEGAAISSDWVAPNAFRKTLAASSASDTGDGL